MKRILFSVLVFLFVASTASARTRVFNFNFYGAPVSAAHVEKVKAKAHAEYADDPCVKTHIVNYNVYNEDAAGVVVSEAECASIAPLPRDEGRIASLLSERRVRRVAPAPIIVGCDTGHPVEWIGPHNPWGHGIDRCGHMVCHHGWHKGGPESEACRSCLGWLMKRGMTQAAALHALGYVAGAGVGALLAPRPRFNNTNNIANTVTNNVAATATAGAVAENNNVNVIEQAPPAFQPAPVPSGGAGAPPPGSGPAPIP